MGWSEIPRYAFDLPEGWSETPVSIADLGGTEVSSCHQSLVHALCQPSLGFESRALDCASAL